MNDPYSVLGITPGADEETIKKPYLNSFSGRKKIFIFVICKMF